MADASLETHRDAGIVARLHRACIDFIKPVVSLGKDDPSFRKNLTPLRRALQSLSLWGLDHAVADGSLDSRLQTSRHLQVATLNALRAVAQVSAFGMIYCFNLLLLLGLLRALNGSQSCSTPYQLRSS